MTALLGIAMVTAAMLIFASGSGDGDKRQVPVRSCMMVSTADAAIAASVQGLGLARVLSHQVAEELRDGWLVRVLANDEPPAMPVGLIYPGQWRLPMKTLAFFDFASVRLRERLVSVKENEPKTAPGSARLRGRAT